MLGQGIVAGSGSEITPGQVLGRGRIAQGQDRSGNRLRDRSGTGSGTWQGRSGAGSQRDQAPGSLRDRFWDVAGSLWGRIAAGSGSRIAAVAGSVALAGSLRWQVGRIVAVAGSDPVGERPGAPYRNIYID